MSSYRFTQRELDELRKSEEFFRSLAAGAFQADSEPGPLGFSHEAYERLRQIPPLVQPSASLDDGRGDAAPRKATGQKRARISGRGAAA